MIQSEKHAGQEQSSVDTISDGAAALVSGAAQFLALSHEIFASTTDSVAVVLAQARSVGTEARARLGSRVNVGGAVSVGLVALVEEGLIARLSVSSVDDAGKDDGDDSERLHFLVKELCLSG